MNYTLVFIGGGLGSVLRFAIGQLISKFNISLQIATLSANMISCLIFALVLYAYQEKNLIPDNYKFFILVGICGGLSTFSTFSFETFELVRQGLFTWAIINIAASLVLCTGLFFALVK